jgi:2-desacetyl-2-hydroxyethyl bacteriochlorophyllide A dehydrogenase
MNTLILDHPGHFVTSERRQPDLPSGYVLLRVHRVGICGTDLHAYLGDQPMVTYPRILGHELGCTVEAVGEGVTRFRPGDRAAIEPMLPCGNCYACRIGKSNCCANLRVLGVHVDGGMTERIVMPQERVHVSDRLSLEELALVETLTIGAHAVQRSRLEAGETILIFGAGPIGLGAMQVAQAVGARTLLVDIADHRLKLASELGADETINPTQVDLVETVAELTDGEGPPVVLEAIGRPETMAQTIDLVAQGGRIVLVGFTDKDVSYQGTKLIRKEVDLLGSRNSRGEFSWVIQLAEEGKIQLSAMVSHRLPLFDAPGFFEDQHAGRIRSTKAVLSLD